MKERFEKRIPFTFQILSKISRLDELKGRWKGGLNIAPHILGRLRKTVIITSTGASTRIEGVKMTDTEIEKFLRSIKFNAPENRDEEEVAGYADLLGRIFDNWQTMKLSESLILTFHGLLLQYSQKDQLHKGKYKTKENLVVAQNKEGEQVVIFRPTEAWLTKKEMDDVLFWTDEVFVERKLHPVLIIANFIFEFLAIHPFSDGNGRISRALTNLLLLQNGYEYASYVSLEEIVEERIGAYYFSLRQTQFNHKTEKENIGPWLDFFLDTLLTQAERASELITNDDPVKLLSGRQSEIYKLFTEISSSESLSVLDIKEKLVHIPEITIKQALSRLVVLGLVERNGLGRGTRYFVVHKK